MKSRIRFFAASVLLACLVSVADGQSPEIVTQPTNAVALAGGTAAFSVAVSGTGPFTYQWQHDGTNLPDGVIITVAGSGTGGFSGDGGLAANAELSDPSGVAVDPFGNLFITDQFNERIRRVGTDGIITTVAGDGTNGYIGDSGAATKAELNNPSGVAVDASGNLFIADAGNNRVRKVATNGIITTVAGNGIYGYSGDGGAATKAELNNPLGVAMDAIGNLFIADADTNYNVIREVGTNGIITTVAGNGTEEGYSGDGGAATNAELFFLAGVAVDASGDLFIADAGNNRIRKVASDGIITTVAGGGTNGLDYSGPATNAQLLDPEGVAVDAFGNLFIADTAYQVIRKVGTDGIITTIAGNGTYGYSGDGGPAIAAELSNPGGVAVDISGNLFIADAGNQRIREVVFPGPTLILNNVSGARAGTYDVVVSSPHGSVTSSLVTLQVLLPPTIITQPLSLGVAIGSNASLSVAATGTEPLDYQWFFDDVPLQNQTHATLLLSAAAYTNTGSYNVVVRNLYGSVTSAVAVVSIGIPPDITGQTGGQANLLNSTAAFSVAASGTGPLTYQWQFDGTNLPDGIITTMAGDGTVGYSGDGGAATHAALNYPSGVAVDAFGNVFFADSNNQRIREVGADGIITTVAGNGMEGYSGDGGAAIDAELNDPSGVAVDAFGNLFIADTDNQRIREVRSDGIITTVAGNGTRGFSGDGGPAIHAWLNDPAGVAVDAFGNLFIADAENNRIRKVGTNGIIATMAGDGTIGYSGDGGAATSAELNYPSGVTLDASGNLFITDQFNERIRRVGTDGIITTVAGNGILGYSGDGGAATNAELHYPYGVVADASGNLFIADAFNYVIRKVVFPGPTLILNNVSAANAGTYDVVVSNPYGSVTSSIVTLLVLLPPTIAAEPQNESVAIGSNATLSVAAAGTAPLVYQWYFDGGPLSGQTNATLSLRPAGSADAGSYEVMVTNLYGSVNSVVAVVSVGMAPDITAQPVSVTNLFDSAADLTVTVTGTGPFAFQWQHDGTNLPDIITTVAGGFERGDSGDGGAATDAELNNPGGAALDSSGKLFIADTYNSVIRQVGTNGIITTLAGGGTNGPGYSGPATNAQLAYPQGVAVDAFGNLFTADSDNDVIRKVGTNGTITTVAGGGSGGVDYRGPATNAELEIPMGVAVDSFGNLFLADSDNDVVRKVGTNGMISTVAGNGSYGYFGDGGPATNAGLDYPSAVAVDALGNLFIADTYNGVIREVGIDGIITTVAGGGTNYPGEGGAATNAGFYYLTGVTVDASGNLFIADSDYALVCKVGTDGIISIAAGDGIGGYSGDGGAATSAELDTPVYDYWSSSGGYTPSMAVALEAAGNLFIADAGNNRIREVVVPGSTLELSRATGGDAGTYDVVISSPYGSITSSIANLTVLFPPAITAPPQSQGIALGSNATLNVVATGTVPISYQWYFDGATLPAQTNTTLELTAAGYANAGSYTVVVTNLYGALISAAAVITVGIPPAISIQPDGQTDLFNTVATFSVAVSGTGPFTYQWQFNGTNQSDGVITTVAGGGTNSSDYRGPATNAQLANPQGVAVDSFGNQFIADTDNGVIRKVETNGLIITVAGGGTNGFDYLGPATNAALNPQAVAVDAFGNLFIADSEYEVIRKLGTNGIITTVAGNGTPGYSGDGGAATNAQLGNPTGVTVDLTGNLYIADSANPVVRKVGTNGIVTTVAGNGTPGYSGDGGPAINAQLDTSQPVRFGGRYTPPLGVTVDTAGNLFIADAGNQRIREVGTDGIITTVAGTGFGTGDRFGGGYSGDGGAATNAEFDDPSAVAVDALGNLFIADTYNGVVREVGTDGIITTVAGNGTHGYSGDMGLAIAAELADPAGVSVDASGNLFIADADNSVIRKVVFPGPTLTLNNLRGANAGLYDVVVSSPYGSVTSSVAGLVVLLPPIILTEPESLGIATGSNATLTVAATGTVPLAYQWYFDGAALQGQTNSTLELTAAGYADAGFYSVVVTNLYGVASNAVAVVTVGIPPAITVQPVDQSNLLNAVASFSVAVSGTGPFSYQWQFNGTNLPDGIITTAAGNGTPGYSGDGGEATKAELTNPSGVAVDAFGNLFIADTLNNRIRKVGTNGIITTAAGNGTPGYSGDGGAATNAELKDLSGVALDAFGNQFIADAFNSRIRKVGTNGIISTVAGNGTPGYSGDDGAATNAELRDLSGVAVDPFGNLFIADSGNQRIRKVGTNGIISTAAGNGIPGYSGDGGAAITAALYYPNGVAVDAFGNLFIADSGNQRIRKVGTDGIITTVAGNGTNGYSGDGGPATDAQLNDPNSVAVDTSGNLFIADGNLNVIRKVGTNGIITTVAGNGGYGYSGDDGPATNAELRANSGMAADVSGNLYIADAGNNRIRQVVSASQGLVLRNVNGSDAGSYDVAVSSPYGSVTSSVVTLVVTLNPINAVSLGGREMQLQFQGVPGDSYVLISTDDLTPPVEWHPVITNAAEPNGNWTFTVTNILSGNASFYRLSAAGP